MPTSVDAHELLGAPYFLKVYGLSGPEVRGHALTCPVCLLKVHQLQLGPQGCDLVNVNYEYEEQNVCAHHQTGHRRIDREAADFSGRARRQPGYHPNEQEFSKHYSVREPTALPKALVDAKPDQLEPQADQQYGSDGSKKNHASRED